MERNLIFSGHDVRDSVAAVGNRAEATTGRDEGLLQVGTEPGLVVVALVQRGLAGREQIRRREDLVEEGRLLLQVALDHVQCEQVPVDALSAHGVSVQFLVSVTRHSQRSQSFFSLE